MSRPELWLPNPADGTSVCGGFDGSLNNDWTAIRLETRDGLIFTPRYGTDKLPTIWNPERWGGVIPRQQVRVAWREINRRYRMRRIYCDPGFHDEDDWTTEIEEWDQEFGSDRCSFVQWPTNILNRMYPALRRFESDVQHRRVRQDGCPITATHLGNARKIPVGAGDKYTLGKPSPGQKIDAGVTTVICHVAACDERDAGWSDDEELPPLVFSM